MLKKGPMLQFDTFTVIFAAIIQGRKTILVRKLFILALAKYNLLNRTTSRFEARLVY